MTGKRSFAAFAGVQMFRYRQSSLVDGWLLPRHGNAFLHACRRERSRLARSFPRRNRLRFAPAQLAQGRRGERHTHINSETVLRHAVDGARFDRRRFCPGGCCDQAQRARHTRFTPTDRHRHAPVDESVTSVGAGVLGAQTGAARVRSNSSQRGERSGRQDESLQDRIALRRRLAQVSFLDVTEAADVLG